MKGKEKCRILKEIRQKIATENDIPFVTSECKHQGDCKGTCPKCEAELQYLENELAKRRSLGKRIAVAGLVATFTFAGTACDFGQNQSSFPPESQTESNEDRYELDGDMVIEGEEEEGSSDIEPPTGAVDEDDDDIELGGDPAPEENNEP